MIAKTFNTPLLTGRKAFGAVNKMTLTPAVNPQEKKLLKPQVTTYMNLKKMKPFRLIRPSLWFMMDILLNTGD